MRFSINGAAGLLFLIASCSSIAQGIQWKPVTSGNSQNNGSNYGGSTWTPIGSNSYGSNGESSYQSGGSTTYSNGSNSYNTGGVTTHSDGTRTWMVGETLYGETPDGRQYYCRMQGGQAVCKPR